MRRFGFLVLCLCFAVRCAADGPARGLFDLEDDTPLETKLSGFGNLKDLVYLAKNVVKEIIEESLHSLWDYAKGILHHFKVKLLKKLARWTVADLFASVFDGVTELMVDSPGELEGFAGSGIESVNPEYNYNPYLWRG